MLVDPVSTTTLLYSAAKGAIAGFSSQAAKSLWDATLGKLLANKNKALATAIQSVVESPEDEMAQSKLETLLSSGELENELQPIRADLEKLYDMIIKPLGMQQIGGNGAVQFQGSTLYNPSFSFSQTEKKIKPCNTLSNS
jgi:hypothetical protein